MQSRIIRKLSDNSVISTENFTYDHAGNMTDATGHCFAYGSNNKLVTFDGQGVSYDADGNMTFGNNTCCEYDSLNRLISAGAHDYMYNAENVRIRNKCDTHDTTYVYNTNCKLSQLLEKTTNGITTKYVYGLGLIGEEKQGCFKTYHFDSRGSTIALTDENGNITDTFAYDTYGKCISHTGDSFIIFGYNGRDGVVTDKNGLIYMRARYYSPDMKRFINADIVAGTITNAATLNRYAYANANPVMFIDPLGLYYCGRCGDAGCGACLDKDTLIKVQSGEISNPNVKPRDNSEGGYKPSQPNKPSTSWDDDDTGDVVSKDDYYGKKENPNNNSQTSDNNRDYEAEAIERKHAIEDTWLGDTVDWLNDNARNRDGSFSLYDNDRWEDLNAFHEQIFVFTPSDFTWNWKERKFGGSLSFDFVTGGWEDKYFDLSILDFGHAEIAAEIKDGKVRFGAFASIWSPSISFEIGGLTFEVGAEVGAVGAGFYKTTSSISLYGSYKWLGASVSVSKSY